MTAVTEKLQIKEIKKVTPDDSLALQTYEFFDGDAENTIARQAFLEGQTTRLVLTYPLLAESPAVDQHVSNLHQLVTEGLSTSATPEYRVAEAYFLQAARRINSHDRPVTQREIDSFQELNEALYGVPNPEIVSRMLANIWGKLDAKRDTVAQSVIDELENGFTLTDPNGETVAIPPLPKPESSTEPLPVLSEEALLWINEKLMSNLKPVQELFQKYADDVLVNREDKNIYPEEIAMLFEAGIAELGLEGVSVIKKEDATKLSWSSADNAVHVGMKRKPIEDIGTLLGVFAHEVGVHGTRYFNGLEHGDQPLATGLFTEADADENPDYLTFEEGLASVVQEAVQFKTKTWDVAGCGLYLNVELAHRGWTPLQIEEVMSRVRMVVSTKSTAEEVSETTKQKARSNAATQVIRVFRGTPSGEGMQTTDGVTLHYAKDLTYASGKIKAIDYLNRMVTLPEAQRDAVWEALFMGKHDPTNRRHRAYVESFDKHDRIRT